MAKLDSLIVDLQVNTAELKKGLDEANAKLSDFGKKMDDLAGVITFEKIGGMALEAGKALANFALHGAETLDKMGKMAQSAGVAVESFSQWNYAASLADVSTEQLGAAMLKLNQNLAKAGSGSKEQAAIFRELGVAVKDSSGHVRTADDVMKDLAGAFSKLRDGAAKTTLVTELFGKSGAQLIPLLNEGAEGFAKAAAEADKFGITVSGSAAAAAAEFNDNLTRMQSVMDVVAQRVAAQLAPAMTTLSNELLNTKEGASTLSGVVTSLSVILKGLVSAGVIVGAVFEAVGKTIARLASAITNIIAGRFQQAWEDLKGQFTDIGDAAGDAARRIDGVWTEQGKSADDANQKTKRSADGIVNSINNVSNAYKALKLVSGAASLNDGIVRTRGFVNASSGGDGHIDHSREATHDDGGSGGSSDHAAAAEVLDLSDSVGEELGQWFDNMSGILSSGATQMMGAVGELVNSVVAGAQAGGVWGAVIAAFMEIAKRTKSALEFLDTAMQFVEKIAEMVEPLVKPIFAALQGVLEIVVDIVAPVFKALQPFFNAISQLVNDLSPVIWAIGDLLAAVSPIIEFVGMLIGRIFEALKPVWTMIGGIIKVIAVVILGILIGLNELAAAFGDKKAKDEAARMRALVDKIMQPDSSDGASSRLDARAEVKATGEVKSTGNVTATGQVDMKQFDLSKWFGDTSPMDVIDIGGWGYAAGSIAGAEAAKAFVEASLLIAGATAEAAAAAGAEAYDDFLGLGSAASGAAAELNKFSASLTNVPTGFKYDLNKFNSTMGEGGTAALDMTAGTMTIIVQGSVISEGELIKKVREGQKKINFRGTGNTNSRNP